MHKLKCRQSHLATPPGQRDINCTCAVFTSPGLRGPPMESQLSDSAGGNRNPCTLPNCFPLSRTVPVVSRSVLARFAAIVILFYVPLYICLLAMIFQLLWLPQNTLE